MKYTICRGCPASGKTTWAKKNSSFILNRDNVRRELFNFDQWHEYKFTAAREREVTTVLRGRLEALAKAGQSCINDNTNLNDKYFYQEWEMAEKLGFEVESKTFFNVPLHKLLERNLNREYSVEPRIIHDMFSRQLKIQHRNVFHDSSKKSCILVDIDGTVASMRDRNPYDWDKVGEDVLRPNVAEVVEYLMGKYPVVFLTGRDGVAYNATYQWLKENFNGRNWELHSRREGDCRVDSIIKEEAIFLHVLPHYNIKYAIDDRDQVVDHYRAMGLEVWQVAAGRF